MVRCGAVRCGVIFFVLMALVPCADLVRPVLKQMPAQYSILWELMRFNSEHDNSPVCQAGTAFTQARPQTKPRRLRGQINKGVVLNSETHQAKEQARGNMWH